MNQLINKILAMNALAAAVGVDSAFSPFGGFREVKMTSLRNNSAYGKKRRAKNRIARASRRRNRK